MENIKDIYAKDLFSTSEIKKRINGKTFERFEKAQDGQCLLNEKDLIEIANAMQDWALENKATHFTHWFQPLTGGTAEKHDSFINTMTSDKLRTKKFALTFSWKDLVKGEPDASSFPNGGLRNTAEARGYTIWDLKSPAFIRRVNGSCILYIPATFHTFDGTSLDKKTPLIKSVDVVSKSIVNLHNLISDEKVTKATPLVRAEQEYFLFAKEKFEARQDLKFSGKTLFGASPSKMQELEDHYFGTINPAVLGFMTELNEKL